MSLATPYALVLTALALPVLVFYILKVRLRRVPVSTNLFWKQIYDEKPPRSLWQRLRHLLSLLAQLLILALLVLAVADPYFYWQLLRARRMVIVIDNSASMQATDVQPTRFQAAVDAAVHLADGLRYRDETAIIVAGPQPQVLLGMSGHVPTIKRTLRTIAVSDNPTELSSAIDLGKRLVGDDDQGEVVVFTDGCEATLRGDVMRLSDELDDSSVSARRASSPGAGASAVDQADDHHESPKVHFELFGTEVSNIGITQLQVRRSLIDSIGYEVLVAVRNASGSSARCRLELELNGAPLDVLPLKLKPNELWTRSLEKTSLDGGRLVARLTSFELDSSDSFLSTEADSGGATDGGDGRTSTNALDVDDVAWAILPDRKVQPVLLITEGNLFLRKVFEANPLVRVSVREDFPQQWPLNTLIVFHGEVPDVLPDGDVLVVDPRSDCDQWTLGETIEHPIVTEQDQAASLMVHVNLDNVVMPEARKLQFQRPPHVLAGALSGDPVYARVLRDNGQCLVLTINLERSDLAFRTAFPIMMTNALGWYAGTEGDLRPSSSTGTITTLSPTDTDSPTPAGAGSESWLLRSPSGKETPVIASTAGGLVDGEMRDAPHSEARLSLGPFDESGIWTLLPARPTASQASEASGNRSMEPAAEDVQAAAFAVNLASVAESDLRPSKTHLQLTGRAMRGSRLLSRPLWFYLASLVCGLLLLEWVLYQRRVLT